MEESSISSTQITEPSPSSERPWWQEEIQTHTHVLRQILGLDLGGGAELGQNLPRSSIKDVLIVALDIENGSLEPHGGRPKKAKRPEGCYFQVGLSILDTRQLHHRDSGKPLVQGYQLCAGSDDYCSTASRGFCFGQSEQITLSTIGPRILELIGGRDFVLVFFDSRSDMRTLNIMGLKLEPLFIIDASKVAQDPFPDLFKRPLSKLLETLGSPFEYSCLHGAGNDAAFTIRALSLLAVLIAGEQSVFDYTQKSTLAILQRVGTAEVPPNYHRQRHESWAILFPNRPPKRRPEKIASQGTVLVSRSGNIPATTNIFSRPVTYSFTSTNCQAD